MNRADSSSLGERVLAWALAVLAPGDRADEIAGDLLEEARRRVRPRWGRLVAAAWLALQVLASAPHLVGMRLRRLRPERSVSVIGADDTVVTKAEAHAAFGAFLAHAHARRELRSVPLALSIAAHIVLVGVGTVASLWTSVDELAPPAVMVTWQPAPPPAMMDKPASHQAGGGDAKSARAVQGARRKVTLEKPRDTKDVRSAIGTDVTPSAQIDGPPSDGPPSNGPPGPPTDGPGGNGPAVLPPQVVARACVSCPDPALPPAWQIAGIDQRVLARLCAGSDGIVKDVRVLQGISPGADDAVIGTLRTWRHSPYQVQGRPVPFCYTTRITFRRR